MKLLLLLINIVVSEKIYCHFHNTNAHKDFLEKLENINIFLRTNNKNFASLDDIKHIDKFDKCYKPKLYQLPIINSNGTNKTTEEYLNTEYSWNMDVINENIFKLDKNEYHVQEGNDGEDIDVYVFDTGIDNTHETLLGKVKTQVVFVGNDTHDNVGHGTHVSGTIAGNYFGIAKNVNLHSVKICEEEGCIILDALIWFLQNIAPTCKRCVINMSLGGVKYDLDEYGFIIWPNMLEDYIINHISTYYNVIFVVAAGNSGDDLEGFYGGYSCINSPAGAKQVITVGAFNKANNVSFFSSWGDCVDVYAPGEEVISAKVDSNNSYVKWAGTSMATPHVTGAIAVLWSNNLDLNSIDMKYNFLKTTLDEDFNNKDDMYLGSRLYLQETFTSTTNSPPKDDGNIITKNFTTFDIVLKIFGIILLSSVSIFILYVLISRIKLCCLSKTHIVIPEEDWHPHYEINEISDLTDDMVKEIDVGESTQVELGV